MSDSSLPEAGKPLGHFVSTAEFDPQSTEKLTPAQEKYYFASQRQLIWWKFKKHRLAYYSGLFLLFCYFVIAFAEFIAPYDLSHRHIDDIYAPPQGIHFFEDGKFVGPRVYQRIKTLDMEILKREYSDNMTKSYPVRFLCKGDPYRFWGLIEGDTHLFCAEGKGDLFLLGTDRLGRDMFSRIIYGARISLTIGLIGITVSFVLGITIGGLAGYYGGWVDAWCSA